LFLETAHPAKFKDTVEPIIGTYVAIPARLAAFMQGTKQSVPMTAEFTDFKTFLMSR
ncbi:MAG: threonine synthase, partial [Bacteroidales bacterium]|nr:threonine synthase [Bacteroidales bacterium]